MDNPSSFSAAAISADGAQHDLSDEEMLAAVSLYKKQKSETLINKKCGYCGYDLHNKQICPAKNKKCINCGKKGHFAFVCRPPKDKVTSSVIISAVKQEKAEKLPKIKVEVNKWQL